MIEVFTAICASIIAVCAIAQSIAAIIVGRRLKQHRRVAAEIQRCVTAIINQAEDIKRQLEKFDDNAANFKLGD